MGINRRFRCYRYVPGRYYRPHIDGAWPQSGLSERLEFDDNFTQRKSAKYVWDESDGKVSSKFTFLLYLNGGDEFEGGETTFFIPKGPLNKPDEEKSGRMVAFPVKPVQGGVLIFPHGNLDAMLHEGSPVLKGAKYVVRTDVLYPVDSKV